MDTTPLKNLIDWYKKYSLRQGETFILEFFEKSKNKSDSPVNNLEKIIRSLVEFVTESKKNPEEFFLFPNDKIIISSLATVDKDYIHSVVPVMWYGLGLQTGDYDLWEPEQIIKECEEVFSGAVDNVPVLIRNIREVGKNEDAINFCQKFINQFILLDKCTIITELNWHNSLIIAIALNTVYERLYQLSEDEQKIILQHSLYVALCAGINVQTSLQAVLYHTKTIFSFIATYERLTQILEESNETVIQINENSIQTLGSLWNDYCEKNKNDWSDIKKLKFFSDSLTTNEFQKEKKFSITAFVKRLVEIIGLQDMEQIENVLLFSGLLRELNWMPEDDNLISFHESTSQFHWNQELLS